MVFDLTPNLPIIKLSSKTDRIFVMHYCVIIAFRTALTVQKQRLSSDWLSSWRKFESIEKKLWNNVSLLIEEETESSVFS